jgi:hypothetical protein
MYHELDRDTAVRLCDDLEHLAEGALTKDRLLTR